MAQIEILHWTQRDNRIPMSPDFRKFWMLFQEFNCGDSDFGPYVMANENFILGEFVMEPLEPTAFIFPAWLFNILFLFSPWLHRWFNLTRPNSNFVHC